MGARETDLVLLAGFSRPLTGRAQLRSPWGRRLVSDGISVLLLQDALAQHLVIGSMADDTDTTRSLRFIDPLAKKLAGSVVLLKAGRTAAMSSEDEAGDLIRRCTDLKCDMVVLDESETDASTSLALIAQGICSVLLLRHR